MRISHDDVAQARQRIVDGVLVTPCMRSAPLSELTGCDVFVKMDNLQRTGSFKERGARNALLLMDEAQRRRGVIAASAGNHALGLAHHGSSLGIPVTVVMPESAPLVKRTACAHFGANVVLRGQTFNDAFHEAQRLAAQSGLRYVHGYDDPAIIAGQGTMGLEILEQVRASIGRDPDAVIVPIGGGGLIAGVAAAVKQTAPETLILGVEPERAATFHAARAAGKPVHVDVGKTLADGLATPDIGANAFETANPLVDGLVMVDEAAISIAILRLLEYEKTVAEGAAAAPLAALIRHVEEGLFDADWPDLRGKTVVLPICGGNIDPAMIGRVIERGLAADGRLTRFVVTISDRPGGLARLTGAIAKVGASIRDVWHDRAFATSDLASVDVRCVVETSGPEHVRRLMDALDAEGFDVRIEHGQRRADESNDSAGGADV